MLHRYITPGLYIDGLNGLCRELNPHGYELQPREAGRSASWSFERNVLSASVLTFADNGKDSANKVKLLPYLKSGISYTSYDNRPVISGPFSGCILRGFKKEGALYVAHVNRTEKKPMTTSMRRGKTLALRPKKIIQQGQI